MSVSTLNLSGVLSSWLMALGLVYTSEVVLSHGRATAVRQITGRLHWGQFGQDLPSGRAEFEGVSFRSLRRRSMDSIGVAISFFQCEHRSTFWIFLVLYLAIELSEALFGHMGSWLGQGPESSELLMQTNMHLPKLFTQ